jgi:hypothetical protein
MPCAFDGWSTGYPYRDNPKGLYGIKMNGPYVNMKACTDGNNGQNVYKNGEFVSDGTEGDCNRRLTGGADPEEQCVSNGGRNCSYGDCGDLGCCGKRQRPRYKRQYYLAPRETCVLGSPPDGIVQQGDFWVTCDPDWIKPDNPVNQDVMKKFCLTADLADPRCKTFCASYPELCVQFIQSRCNSADRLGAGICNDLCNTKNRTGNVAAACNAVVDAVCKNDALLSPVCQGLCFKATTPYDCKLQLEDFCKLPANQGNAMCACYLPPARYVTYYGQLFAGVADPNLASTLQSQAQAVPYCSYPPCSTNESFKPRGMQQCPNQQICLQQIVNKGGKAEFNGNVNLNQECNLLVKELNTSPSEKKVNEEMGMLAGSASAGYAILNDTTITAAGTAKPLDHAANCGLDLVYNTSNPSYDVTKNYSSTCTSAINTYCGGSIKNMEGEFCQTLCNTTPDYAPITEACTAAVSKLCTGKQALGSDMCKTMCFSEETPYDCTAALQSYCTTSGSTDPTYKWWTDHGRDPVCDCHQGAARYTQYFADLFSGSASGSALTQVIANTQGLLTTPTQSRLDYVATQAVNACAYSLYWPRSTNPAAPEFAAGTEEYDCIVDMRKGTDLLGNPILVYKGDLSKATKTCKDLVAALKLQPTLPTSLVDHPEEDLGNIPTQAPDPNPTKSSESTSSSSTLLVVLVVVAVLFFLLRKKGNAGAGEEQAFDVPGYAPPGYAPQGYAPPGYAPQGYAPPGYAPQGYAPQGYAPQGFAPQGFAPQGFAAPAY